MQRLLTFIGADDQPVRVAETDADAWKQQEQAEGRAVRPARAYLDEARNPVHVLEEDAPDFEAQAAAEGRKIERARPVLVGEEPIYVGDSRREQFIRDYRSNPEWQADREAARGRVGVGESGSGGVGSGAAQGARRGLDDAGVTITKGIASLPQLAAGLADLSIEMSPVVLAARAMGAPLPAGGMAGRALEQAVPLAATQAALQEQYSPEQQEAFQSVAKAGAGKGPLGRAAAVAGELASHPTVVAHATLESLPAMAVGGAIGRAVSPVLAAAGMTPAAAGMTAGAIGEGVAAAGSAQEQIRAVSPGGATTGRQSALALGSGLLTGGIGVLANRLAGSAVGRRLGLGAADIDTMLAGGGGGGGGAGRGVLPRLFAGAAQEGLLEELPQSAQEQIMQNLALGRPWSEGVIEAGITGAAVGTAMGVGANIAPPAGGGGAVGPRAGGGAVGQAGGQTVGQAVQTPVVPAAVVEPVRNVGPQPAVPAQQPPVPAAQPTPVHAERQEQWQAGAAKAVAAANAAGSGNRERWESVTPQENVRVGGRWVVVDADGLITSDRPGYPLELLQQRDRDTAASKEQISQIANAPDPTRLDQSATTDGGAPIIRSSGHVLSGNGRVMGIRQAYDNGTAGEYRGYVLAVAQGMGVDASSMRNPVLIREMDDVEDAVAKRVADLSNRPAVLQRTAAEMALSDADSILGQNLLDVYNPNENGDVRAAGNREFLSRFVAATGDQGLRTKDGGFDPTIDARVRRAILHVLLGNDTGARETSRLLTEDRERLGMQRQVDGVLIGARNLMNVARQKPEYDLIPALGKALRRVVQYRQEKAAGGELNWKTWAGQQDLFADPDSTDALSEMLAHVLAEARSIKQVQTVLLEYSRLAGQVIPEGENLFAAEAPNEKRGQLLNRALENAANEANNEASAQELQLGSGTGGAPARNPAAQPRPAGENAGGGVPAGRDAAGAGEVGAAGADQAEAAAREAMGMDEGDEVAQLKRALDTLLVDDGTGNMPYATGNGSRDNLQGVRESSNGQNQQTGAPGAKTTYPETAEEDLRENDRVKLPPISYRSRTAAGRVVVEGVSSFVGRYSDEQITLSKAEATTVRKAHRLMLEHNYAVEAADAKAMDATGTIYPEDDIPYVDRATGKFMPALDPATNIKFIDVMAGLDPKLAQRLVDGAFQAPMRQTMRSAARAEQGLPETQDIQGEVGIVGMSDGAPEAYQPALYDGNGSEFVQGGWNAVREGGADAGMPSERKQEIVMAAARLVAKMSVDGQVNAELVQSVLGKAYGAKLSGIYGDIETAAKQMTARPVATASGAQAPTARNGGVAPSKGSGLAGAGGPTATGADIAAAARNKARGGAVTLPDSRMLDAARKTWARFRTLFDPNRGVPAPVYAAFTQMRRSLEGAALMGRGDRAELLGIMRDLEGSVGRDVVRNALQQVQDGVIDTAMFSHVLGLPAGNVAERTLGRIQAANVAREKAIAAWPGLTEGMRQTIRDNANYQTRKYLRFILGDDYTPPEMAYRDAVAEIEAGLQDAVDRVARRAGALRGRRGTLDVVAWLETGNPRLLAGVPPKRLVAAQKLRKQYLEVRGVIDSLVLAGDKVTASVNAEAMSKAAAGWVDYYLGREGGGAAGRGGVDISSFQHRFLEGAFRALYGEITDPAVRQQLTSETQAKMLAQMTFFQRVLDEAEGTVWARMPDPAKRMDQKLGDAKNPGDRMRYGEMAGRFVTPEFKQLIDAERGSGATHQVMKAIWFGPMSLQRGAKLANPKTILRNYYTALQGFALGSGDATLPGYWRHFYDGHAIAILYARGDVAAIRTLQPLFESGVFTPGASTAVADLQAALGTAKGRMSNGLRKFAEAYAFIDFPTKYAAYMARRDSGMTHEQAVDHVRRLYQNRDAIPLAFGKLSRLGMADYVNYTADSARIMANQLRWAADSIKRGDPGPLIGFALSRALWAAAAGTVTMLLAKGVAGAARKLRGDDKDKDLVESAMTTDKTEAFRMFLPRYDRSTPLVTSISRDSNGRTRHVRYTIMGGQSAFPLEDIAIGALQGPMRGSGYLDAVLQGLGQMVDEGMLVDTYLRTLTGEDISGKRTPTGKGLLDALPGTPEPARAQIVQDALVGATLDMLPQYPIGMVKDLYAKEQKDAAGQRDVGIFARKMDAADILARGHRLVRSYNLDREDMNRMVRDRVAPFAEGLRSVSMMVNVAAGATIEKGGATDKQKRLAEAAQTKRIGYMRDLIEIARAAKDVAPDWFAAPAMLDVLTKSGISSTDARMVLIGAHGDLPDPVLRKTQQPNVDILDTGVYQKVFGRDS